VNKVISLEQKVCIELQAKYLRSLEVLIDINQGLAILLHRNFNSLTLEEWERLRHQKDRLEIEVTDLKEHQGWLNALAKGENS